MRKMIEGVRGLASLATVILLIGVLVLARFGPVAFAASASPVPVTSGSPVPSASESVPVTSGSPVPSASESVPVTSGSPVPTVSLAPAPVALVHFKGVDISFDYPATWNALPRSVMGNSWIAAFSTGPAPTSCCVNYVIPANTMDVSIAYGSGEINVSTVPLAKGEARVVAGSTVAKLKTVTKDPSSGADTRLSWVIQRSQNRYFDIEALIKGPNVGSFKAQLDAMIASIVES